MLDLASVERLKSLILRQCSQVGDGAKRRGRGRAWAPKVLRPGWGMLPANHSVNKWPVSVGDGDVSERVCLCMCMSSLFCVSAS